MNQISPKTRIKINLRASAISCPARSRIRPAPSTIPRWANPPKKGTFGIIILLQSIRDRSITSSAITSVTTSLKEPVPRTASTTDSVAWCKNTANLAQMIQMFSIHIRSPKHKPGKIGSHGILFHTDHDQIFLSNTQRAAKFLVQLLRRWKVDSPVVWVYAEGKHPDLAKPCV